MPTVAAMLVDSLSIASQKSTHFGSYPASSGKHCVKSVHSGCLAVMWRWSCGGLTFTIKVCKHKRHFLAAASLAALAEAAFRSSSDLPSFFWFLSRAAWAFCTFDPLPMVVVIVDTVVDGAVAVLILCCNVESEVVD